MPTIKPVRVGDRTRYRFVVDIGRDPVTGKRLQKTHTFDLLREAKAELDRISHERRTGDFV
jgi:hypothetical protein